jgi:hypothetical protein
MRPRPKITAYRVSLDEVTPQLILRPSGLYRAWRHHHPLREATFGQHRHDL